MSTSLKCPNCAASLVFDADTQQMTCSFCGSVINLADITVEQNPQWKQENWNLDAVSYVCGNCAATVVTDQNTAATFCAFCGSPTIIPERLVEGYRPSYLIPFKYGKEEAIKAFFAWCRKGLMTPKDFILPSNIEKITGLYLPFWLYTIDADVNFSAVGTIVNRHTTGSTTTITTKYYNIVRRRDITWDKIPLDGATHVDDKLMEIVEPFQYSEMIPFDMKYLSGFFAEKFDQDAKALEPRLKERVSHYARQVFDSTCKQYNSVRDVQDECVYAEPRSAYALMPVWMLNYTYRGKKYTFAMNGQTGKIAGNPPISRAKLAIIASSVAFAGGLIASFLGGVLS